MDASDEVRVVAGHVAPSQLVGKQNVWVWSEAAGSPDYRPVLLVIGSGLTAEQMRAALRSRDVLDAIRGEVERQRAATDTGGNDGQG